MKCELDGISAKGMSTIAHLKLGYKTSLTHFWHSVPRINPDFLERINHLFLVENSISPLKITIS
jgi:hypothetical protein